MSSHLKGPSPISTKESHCQQLSSLLRMRWGLEPVIADVGTTCGSRAQTCTTRATVVRAGKVCLLSQSTQGGKRIIDDFPLRSGQQFSHRWWSIEEVNLDCCTDKSRRGQSWGQMCICRLSQPRQTGVDGRSSCQWSTLTAHLLIQCHVRRKDASPVPSSLQCLASQVLATWSARADGASVFCFAWMSQTTVAWRVETPLAALGN